MHASAVRARSRPSRAPGCTCTSRSARRAATTATSRRGPTARHLVDEYVDACVRDLERRALAPVDTVFFGGGTPSLLRRAQLTRILDAIPRGRRRGDGRVQPRLGRPRQVPRVRRRGREPRVVRRAVDAAARARRARPHPRPRQRGPRRRRRHAPPASSAQPRPHLRHARRVASTTGRPPSTPRSRSSRGT